MSQRMRFFAVPLALGVLLLSLPSFAQEDVNGLFRYPDVSGDRVVFTSEGDLWTASLNGGDAVRLTRDDGREWYAHFSPDGQWIAFSAQYEGNTDVYVIPSSGGEPRRLTYHGARDEVVGWTPDSRNIVFRSPRIQPSRVWQLYTIPVEGGFEQEFGLDRGTRISFEPGGTRFAFNRLRREERPWKRYRGGWAMDIWVGDLGTMQFDKVTSFEGTDFFPMWIGDRIYFLSDRSGRFNLFSMAPDGSGIRQHTFEEEWDLSNASTDGKTIIYQKEYDLYAYDVASGESRLLDIHLPSDRFRARERLVKNPGRYIDSYTLPNEARRIAIAARGEVFTFPVEKSGYIRRLMRNPDSREKYVAFSPDGKKVAIMSDASGEEEIWIAPSDGSEEAKQLTTGGDTWRFPMVWSPDGKKLLFGDKAKRLWIADAESGKRTLVDTAPGWEISEYEWSPDSRWVAWIRVDDNFYGNVWLYNIDTKQKAGIERPMTSETSLSFHPDGKHLYFASENWYNPVISALDQTYIYDKTTKIYVVVLAKDGENPFAPKLVKAYEEEEKEEGDEDKEESKKKEEEGEKPIVIDLDGIAQRVYPVPIDAANSFGLIATEGTLYFASRENPGMMPDGDTPKGFQLNAFDIEEKETKVVSTSVRGYDASPDRKKLLIRTGESSFVVMDAGGTEIPKEKGHIDLSDWSFEIEPPLEWRQILRNIWRWERDFFYDPNMHGVDWEGVWKQYSSLLPRISNRDELNDLVREMIGELNIGHAYVWGGDILSAPRVPVGGLGADFEQVAGGAYRITKIYRGDGWGDEPVSPLSEPKVDAKVGEYIVAIDGVPLKPGENIFRRLYDKAGKEILLSLNSTPTMKGAREVVVEPLGSEGRLRYFDWVRERREYVEKASDGRIAYVHLPDMGSLGLSMWGRQYLAQYKRDALLMDVRNNGGGFVAPMILSMLQRTLWSRGKSRESALYHTPNSAFYGPMIAVCDHETGSDGETFSEGFKRLKLGELVGTRTWGGWVGIRGGRRTVDRGGNTQPEFTGWGALDGKWLIEGHGVDPTIEVENDPASVLQGVDPQLDKAVQVLLDELQNKEKWPPLAAPPKPLDKSLKVHNLK